MFVIATSRFFDSNAEALGMHNEKTSLMIQETFGVYQVIGAVVMGSLLTFFRAKFSPSLIIVLVVFIALLGQLFMIWPEHVTVTEPIRITVASSAFAEGGILSLIHI